MIKKKTKTNPQIVIAAIIEKDGRILIGKRRRGKVHPGNWEFPGGTLEEGETFEQCLKREIREELGIEIEVGPPVCSGEYVYGPDWTVRLLAFRTTMLSDVFKLNDHQEVLWVLPNELTRYNFSEAGSTIAEKLAGEAHKL